MSTAIRKKESEVVAKQIHELSISLENSFLYNGEYSTILRTLAYVIMKEGSNGCPELDLVLQSYLREHYGIKDRLWSIEIGEDLAKL